MDRADGNVCAVKNTEQRGKSESPIQINCQDKNAMKSVMRTTKRVVTQDERKRIVTLRPKGTKPDYTGYRDVIGDGQMVSGSQVASKVFIIVCDVELGKPYTLPENPGRSSVRSNEGAEGRGIGKKRMAACNELYRGSKFALTRKGADLPVVSCCMKGGKPVNVRYSITPKTGERLADTRKSVNGLQTGITKAVIK